MRKYRDSILNVNEQHIMCLSLHVYIETGISYTTIMIMWIRDREFYRSLHYEEYCMLGKEANLTRANAKA